MAGVLNTIHEESARRIPDRVRWFQVQILRVMANCLIGAGEGNGSSFFALQYDWDQDRIPPPSVTPGSDPVELAFQVHGPRTALISMTRDRTVLKMDGKYLGATVKWPEGTVEVKDPRLQVDLRASLAGPSGFSFRGVPDSELRIWVVALLIDKDLRQAGIVIRREVIGDVVALRTSLAEWCSSSLWSVEASPYDVVFGEVPLDNQALVQVETLGLIDPSMRSDRLPRWEEIRSEALRGREREPFQAEPTLSSKEVSALKIRHGMGLGYLLRLEGLEGEFRVRVVPTATGLAELGVTTPSSYTPMIWRRAYQLSHALVLQGVVQGTASVSLSAEAVRDLLGLQGNRNWKRAVLEVVDFLFRSKFLVQPLTGSGRTIGVVLSSLGEYQGAGPGNHSQGQFVFHLAPQLFSVLVPQAGDRTVVDAAGARRSYTRMDAGLPWYVWDLSDRQRMLAVFLHKQLSRIPGARTKRGTPLGTSKLRCFTQADCPLLPADANVVGALGGFKRVLGWKLDSHLFAVLGYRLTDAVPDARLRELTFQALDDFESLVVVRLGGYAFARRGREWLALRDARSLPPEIIRSGLAWYFFLPLDWQDRMQRQWESDMAKRGRSVRVTHSVTDAGHDPLARRMRRARIHHGLSQAQLAKQLGVDQQRLSLWEREARPISVKYRPRVASWLDGAGRTPDNSANSPGTGPKKTT